DKVGGSETMRAHRGDGRRGSAFRGGGNQTCIDMDSIVFEGGLVLLQRRHSIAKPGGATGDEASPNRGNRSAETFRLSVRDASQHRAVEGDGQAHNLVEIAG